MAGDDPLVAQCRSRVGRLISGKWRLDALIGVGGMAAVYMATHRNGSMSAVKILHEEVSLNQEVRERFLREAYIANKVNHPGTVKVLDDDKDEQGAPYIVMELLRGETVETRAQKAGGRLPIADTLEILDQTLAVLEKIAAETGASVFTAILCSSSSAASAADMRFSAAFEAPKIPEPPATSQGR